MEKEVKPTKVGKYTLVNAEKVNRALDGAPNDRGALIGGIRKEDGSFEPAELLAEYDRLGGLILMGEDKVNTGSFYDFRNRKAFETPKVEFVYRVNGQEVIVPAEKETPGIVKAAKVVAKKAATKKTTKKVI